MAAAAIPPVVPPVLQTMEHTLTMQCILTGCPWTIQYTQSYIGGDRVWDRAEDRQDMVWALLSLDNHIEKRHRELPYVKYTMTDRKNKNAPPIEMNTSSTIVKRSKGAGELKEYKIVTAPV